MKYQIVVAPTALQMLESIRDKRERQKLESRIDQLAIDPEKQGKPLLRELKGFHSVRAAGGRYRIVYRVEREIVTVLVVGVGRRQAGSKRDVYERVKRARRSRK